MHARLAYVATPTISKSIAILSLLLFLHKHHSPSSQHLRRVLPLRAPRISSSAYACEVLPRRSSQHLITMAASDSLQDIAKSLNNLVTFHNEAPQPLSEFTSFPKLPLEIRLMIFENGLTNDDRVFNIVIFRDQSKTKQGKTRVGVQLAYAPDRKEEGKENYVALLATCDESRSVALKVFKHTLPAYHGGILRFSDRTIFTLANIYSFSTDKSIFPSFGNFARRERIFQKIKSALLKVKRYGIDCSSEDDLGLYVHLHNNFSVGINWIVNQVMLKEIVLVEWEKNWRGRAFWQWNTKRELIDKVSNHLPHRPLSTIQKITYLGWRKDDE
jgi:hypothetical protein